MSISWREADQLQDWIRAWHSPSFWLTDRASFYRGRGSQREGPSEGEEVRGRGSQREGPSEGGGGRGEGPSEGGGGRGEGPSEGGGGRGGREELTDWMINLLSDVSLSFPSSVVYKIIMLSWLLITNYHTKG